MCSVFNMSEFIIGVIGREIILKDIKLKKKKKPPFFMNGIFAK